MERWFKCPYCNQRILKYKDKKGKSKELYIKCKQCGREIEIRI